MIIFLDICPNLWFCHQLPPVVWVLWGLAWGVGASCLLGVKSKIEKGEISLVATEPKVTALVRRMKAAPVATIAGPPTTPHPRHEICVMGTDTCQLSPPTQGAVVCLDSS